MRSLTFSDDKDNEQEWVPGGPTDALGAFLEFIDRHRADDNALFCITDERDEGLVLWLDHGIVARVTGGKDPRTEFRLVNAGDFRKLAFMFIRGGFVKLGRYGPWWPDVPSAMRKQLRFDFDRSVLRRTHPRELCRRLAVLTHIDGREPTTVSGFTHYGFGDGSGDSVDGWFAADGRGLVVTFDRGSPLASIDAQARAALYDGVPPDLLALVRDMPQPGSTIRTSAHPNGDMLVATTGIFTYSGPCMMSEGLLVRLQEDRLDVEDAQVGRLLERFLALEDFTPNAVAQAAPWWSDDDIARGFAAAAALSGERSLTAPLDRDAVDRFCRIWADSGYNDPWGVHYVLFDCRTLEEAGEARDELLSLIQALGLERVDAPAGAGSGEVWVRSDPRIDAELGHWA
ncbi:DUF6357 family protein [Micromonospora saelicesensis]|uniref:DUF6357 family protein n=1 Tax=Micromonospora saelicesensis TaxID=285676 RepID=UPI000DC46AB0|nr:DUF6357 family protein [Micromonospora saelicesensis]RAO61028.1 hypothetical protein PSN01_01936 [Micromonospora saelicesensis]